MTARAVGRSVLVVLLVLLVQATLGLDIRIAGVHPDLMLLLPIATGLALGPEEGAIMGFVAGIAADLILPTPFGLSALIGCLVGFAVGYAGTTAAAGTWWFSSLVALAASGAAVMLYAVLGAVLGQEQFLDVNLAAVVLVVAGCNAILAPAAVRLMRWAIGPTEREGGRLGAAGGAR